MIEVKREEFKKDKMFSKVHNQIKKHHQVPDYTVQTLMDSRNIKDFCVEARFFVMPSKELLLHYDCATWLIKDRLVMKVDTITFYDDFAEFEAARVGQLYSSDPNKTEIPDA